MNKNEIKEFLWMSLLLVFLIIGFVKVVGTIWGYFYLRTSYNTCIDRFKEVNQSMRVVSECFRGLNEERDSLKQAFTKLDAHQDENSKNLRDMITTHLKVIDEQKYLINIQAKKFDAVVGLVDFLLKKFEKLKQGGVFESEESDKVIKLFKI